MWRELRRPGLRRTRRPPFGHLFFPGGRGPQRRGTVERVWLAGRLGAEPLLDPGGECRFGHWRLRAALARPRPALSSLHTCVIFTPTVTEQCAQALGRGSSPGPRSSSPINPRGGMVSHAARTWGGKRSRGRPHRPHLVPGFGGGRGTAQKGTKQDHNEVCYALL